MHEEFVSRYNDKEIAFTDKGIRYNNQAFIQYEDMEEVSVHKDNCVFRYKGHLIKMEFDPSDAPKVETYFARPKEEVQMPVIDNSALNAELDKFSYLDNAPQLAAVSQEKKTKKRKDKSNKSNKKTGIIIGAIIAVAAIAIALIILL